MGPGTVAGSIPPTQELTRPDSALAGYRPLGVSAGGAVPVVNVGTSAADGCGGGALDGTARVAAIVPTRSSAIANTIGTALSRRRRRHTRPTTGPAERPVPVAPRPLPR